MTKLLLKSQPLEAWQYGGDEVAPDWLLKYLEINDNAEILLVRQSGKQLMNKTEWIVIDEDGELAHMTDAYVKRFYEVVEK